MPSKIDWRDLEQNIGRDAYKLESQIRGGSVGVIACVWLVFYVIAVTHSLLSQRAAAPVATAAISQPSQPALALDHLLVPTAIQQQR
jgi:hypothetical protein